MNLLDKKFLLIDASFKIIEEFGWKTFSLEKLSQKEEISLKEINKLIKSKIGLLKEFSNMIDLKVENSIDFKDFKNSSVKDNLFELIMLRLEYMQPYKNSLKKIINALKNDTAAAKSISLNILNSLDFYLDLTDAYNKSLFDILK